MVRIMLGIATIFTACTMADSDKLWVPAILVLLGVWLLREEIKE